jgi:hypothetical protein
MFALGFSSETVMAYLRGRFLLGGHVRPSPPVHGAMNATDRALVCVDLPEQRFIDGEVGGVRLFVEGGVGPVDDTIDVYRESVLPADVVNAEAALRWSAVTCADGSLVTEQSVTDPEYPDAGVALPEDIATAYDDGQLEGHDCGGWPHRVETRVRYPAGRLERTG